MSLIERLEAATEGSRELDAEIHAHVHGGYIENNDVPPIHGVIWHRDEGWKKDARGDRYRDRKVLCRADEAPHYTRSIDAALSLVPEGHCWEIKRAIQCRAVVWSLERDYTDDAPPEGYGPEGDHPALALCIAALKARGVG